VSHNAARLLVSFFGVSAWGRVLVPVNFRLNVDEIGYIIEHSGASVLLVDPELDEALADIDCKHRYVLGDETDAALWPTDAADPGLHRVLAAAARHALPVNLMCTGRLEQAAQLAGRHPNTQLVIDHLGLPQPQEPPAPAAPFADLPTLLALAAHANVAVKISGACTLSHAPFPYQDLWDPLARIFDAFGLHRCLWGTDWTRAVKVLTYKEGVEAFRVTDRLSDSDKAALMGESLTRVYNWAPSQA